MNGRAISPWLLARPQATARVRTSSVGGLTCRGLAKYLGVGSGVGGRSAPANPKESGICGADDGEIENKGLRDVAAARSQEDQLRRPIRVLYEYKVRGGWTSQTVRYFCISRQIVLLYVFISAIHLYWFADNLAVYPCQSDYLLDNALPVVLKLLGNVEIECLWSEISTQFSMRKMYGYDCCVWNDDIRYNTIHKTLEHLLVFSFWMYPPQPVTWILKNGARICLIFDSHA